MKTRRPDALPDLLVIEPEVFPDDRGELLESWQAVRYREAGVVADFVQDNLVRSRMGVLRGLHFQHPHGQGKLVQVVRGEVWDVAVDVRAGSPTRGEWFGTTLSDENRRQLWIPPGFAHGYAVESGEADVLYKCGEYYHPESEHTLRWDDPEVGIGWPIEAPLTSEKDGNGTTLAELEAAGVLPEYGG